MTTIQQDSWTTKEKTLFNSYNPSFLDKSYIMKPIGLALHAGSLITSSGIAYAILAQGFKITIKATLISSGVLFAIELLGLYLILKTSYLDLQVKRRIEAEKEQIGLSRKPPAHANNEDHSVNRGPAFPAPKASGKSNTKATKKKF